MTVDPMPSVVRGEIESRLAQLAAGEGVRLLLAVESGSRAWGFPSPDSDYDVRLVYVRRRGAYLTIKPFRDVIERPITDEIDLAGWDVRKLLQLLLKSNATVVEWLASPIRYRPDDPAMAQIAAFAATLLDPAALARHYHGVGRRAAARWLVGDGPVAVKKYFYALRPALALRWLRQRDGLSPAALPMQLQALVAAVDLAPALAAEVAALVEAKRRTNERANAARHSAIEAQIADEFAHAATIRRRPPPADAWDRADALFLDLVNRTD